MSLRSRLGWYAARASSMSAREVLHRASGAITVARERVAPPAPPAHSPGRPGALRHPAAPRLVDEDTVARVRLLPGASEAAAERAAPLADGRVGFFGAPPHAVGTRPEWHRDPATGSLWPLTHWSRIDHREAGADPKWIWELGRHQHLVHLARAWRLCDEPRFARAACDGLDSFLAQNPPGHGIHWRVGLELGLRLVSWSWTLAFLEGFDGIGAELHGRVVESAGAHLQQLARHPSLYSSANNHRIGELMGLAVGGLCFPEVEGAGEYAEAGLRGLERELARQVHADGVDAEQAIGYQCFVLDMAMIVCSTLRKADRPVPAGIATPTAAMARFLGRIASDGGSLPRIGDEDDALGVDLASDMSDGERLWSRLRTVERLLEIELDRHEPGEDEQTLWLAGPSTGGEDSGARRPGTAVAAVGGYAILRDRADEELRVVLKAGPFGLGPLYAHAHADQLSVCLSLAGQEVVVDGGTFTYYGDLAWRNYGRSTAAHSTVRVDGRDQAEPSGRFMWRTTATGRLGDMTVSDGAIEVAGHHDAYAPVRHERRLRLQDRALLVTDRLTGPPERRELEIRWHLAPGELEAEDGHWTWRSGDLAVRLSMEGLDAVRVALDERRPPAGIVSPGLEQSVPAPALIGRLDARLPATLTTRIEPA
jgi:hypothetical protein